MKRRLLSLALVLALLLSLPVPVTAFTLDAQPEIQSGTVVNPRYIDLPVPGLEDAEPQAEADHVSEAQVFATPRAAAYVTPEKAADQLRQAMLRRQNHLTLHIYASDSWVGQMGTKWFDTYVFPLAISQSLAQNPYDGDYLQWSWNSYDWTRTGENGYHTFEISIRYYTDDAEEAQVARRVTELAQQLKLDSLSPLDGYTAIYDYITATVRYDNDTLIKVSEGQASASDYKIFTAYGALFNQRAVCQGYATLYYALCREAGLPVRIVTSELHAWNIVYLKEIWYDIDCTWDSYANGQWLWFLKGSDTFDVGLHICSSEFLTPEFQAGYPISRYDYDPDLIYNDVPQSSYGYDDIKRATELGLFNGTSTYTFSPDMTINRAMLVTVLWRLEGSPEAGLSDFTDVPADSFYANAVAWAAREGIVNGVGNGQFAPTDNATREQLVTILRRYAEYRGSDVSGAAALAAFSDLDDVSSWALEALQWAVAEGIMNGTSSTTLSPQASANREQLAALLIRLIDRYSY